MRYLDLTLPTAAENLALDEALLEEAEAAAAAGNTAPVGIAATAGRDRPFVADGDGSATSMPVARSGIPILRRVSGGAAVVAGPGCLMYALVLSYQLRPHLRVLSQAHRYVLGTLAAALEPLAPGVRAAAPATWPSTGGSSPATVPVAAATTCSTTARCCTTFRWS